MTVASLEMSDEPNFLYLQQILPTITDKYKGKAVLIDFWNTWCVQGSIINAAIIIKHIFFIFSVPALVFIPPHNADYTCTNCANEKYRRNNMPNGIILMTFKFMEIAYIFLIFLTQEVGKQ